MTIRRIGIVVGVLLFIAGVIISLVGYRPAVQIGVTLHDNRIDVVGGAVRQGDEVRLRILNHGTEVHEVEVEGYDLEVEDIRPGETRTLEFRANRTGSFELVCRMPGHYERGMRAPFTVLR